MVSKPTNYPASTSRYDGLHGGRQLTPPDSPLPSIHAVLGSNQTHTRKMALDFIAPSNDSNSDRPTLPGLDCLSAAAALHRGSRPSTPKELPIMTPQYSPPEPRVLQMETPYNTSEGYDYRSPVNLPSPPEQHDYRISRLPSPVWSSSNSDLSDSQVYHMDPTFPQQSMLPPPVHTHMPPLFEQKPRSMTYHCRPPHISASRLHRRSIQHHAENKLYTSSGAMSHNNQSARAERFPYDDEERYAIIHLRGLKTLKYEDVLIRFNYLFPPGQARRCRSSGDMKGLPKSYPPRNIQGLQCRWYRIRDEENLPKLRHEGRGGDRVRVEDVLDLMKVERDLSVGFADTVHAIAETPNEMLPRNLRLTM
ncbi:hypothetical protein FKW77_000283 [Venturia effusa]|uniref:Uncharacterized protein n=1 Tax=Venturia effusa TaxID=50376 RepID=A0A517LGB2_9PEZI|nr:hypothetical protein FKW77_000283 [Venturia effusa]